MNDSQNGPATIRRCYATVLFSDICASTRLAELVDPEVGAEIVSQVRQASERVVGKYCGVINQVSDDDCDGSPIAGQPGEGVNL
ncbi:MAG: hypothetical protein P8Y45_15320 [Exilibacterium sp.]